MRGKTEAVLLTPPRSAASGEAQSAKKLSFTTSSSAEQTTGVGYWTFYATADVHVAFYAFTGLVTAATTNDYLIPAGQERQYLVDQTPFFKAIGDAASGTLYFFRSSP